jgi:hypothetical protein
MKKSNDFIDCPFSLVGTIPPNGGSTPSTPC